MRESRILLGALTVIGPAAILLASTVALSRSETSSSSQAEDLSATEAHAIAVDAYLFGYPLVTTEMTRRVMTNTATPGDWNAPLGQFAHLRSYPTPDMKAVTTPNADTLYSAAWLDLAREPYVLEIPPMKGRYYMIPLLDAWSEVVQSPGTRTTGSGAQRYAITGPDWKGSLPRGLTEIKSPTNTAWLLGRIYSSGTPEDLEQVHALQDKLTLVPLSAYGTSYTPPRGSVDPDIDMKTPVRDQVDRMSTTEYFQFMAEAMKANPPVPADHAMVARMAKIGLVPGADFDPSKLPATVAKSLDDVPEVARERMAEHLKKHAGRLENGWLVSTTTGAYGTDYIGRATTAAFGFGANLPTDAVYPFSEQDSEGQTYDGAHAYVLRFEKGKEPPVKGFWSLTMYGDDLFFVPNPLDRYSLGDRSSLTRNDDGSIDIYIQKDSPGREKESNWLPAPSGKFRLVMRLYWPSDTPPSILDGTWKPPPVTRVR